MFITIYQILGLVVAILVLAWAIIVYFLRKIDKMEVAFNLRYEQLRESFNLELRNISNQLIGLEKSWGRYEQVAIDHERRITRIETMENKKNG